MGNVPMVCLLFVPECPTMVLLKYTIFYTLSVVWKSLLFLSDMSSVYLFSHTFAISAQMPPERKFHPGASNPAFPPETLSL